MLTLPYVTVAAFKAHPTFLDLLNLRSGDTSLADQDDELRNILLMASTWADNYVEMGNPNGSLAAHTVTEQLRLRPDRYGRLLFHPSNIPVVTVTALAYGRSIGGLTTYTNPTVWIEDGRQVIADLNAGGATWSGQLQFGPPVAGGELYTQWTYVAGYVNTLLAADTTTGSSQLTVADATGITAGTTLRLWEPGAEEAVTVATTYVAGSTTVPLATALVNDHFMDANPVGVSSLPADVHLAVILYATALLMRPDTAAEDAFPDTHLGSSTRAADPRKDGSGLVVEAERLLEPYRRTR